MIVGPVTGDSAFRPVTAVERQCRLGQRPVRVWLTGENRQLIARELERQLFDRGFLCTVLDLETLGEHAAAVLENLNDAGLIALIAAPPERLPAIPGEDDLALPGERHDIHAITRRAQAERDAPLDFQI